ncbi:hypothetical protein DP939_37905 [Spongiactinospora rosea]|uniref:Uncharacterized protein n=1 Tax=Spongiactinospora rosea TaxID=2248750 RepID=A0A366LM16_9ACTN|nr:hypothetical protein [Spongiactinospora rosea]RBQ14965.1 hypothetical protein DP939_37905 [Spongiactinospora rosea]
MNAPVHDEPSARAGSCGSPSFAADWLESDIEFPALPSGDPAAAATAVLGFAGRVRRSIEGGGGPAGSAG